VPLIFGLGSKDVPTRVYAFTFQALPPPCLNRSQKIRLATVGSAQPSSPENKVAALPHSTLFERIPDSACHLFSDNLGDPIYANSKPNRLSRKARNRPCRFSTYPHQMFNDLDKVWCLGFWQVEIRPEIWTINRTRLSQGADSSNAKRRILNAEWIPGRSIPRIGRWTRNRSEQSLSLTISSLYLLLIKWKLRVNQLKTNLSDAGGKANGIQY
jgi:hypothetical protein